MGGPGSMPTADPDEIPVVTSVVPLLFMFDCPGADAEGFADMQHGFLAGVDPEADALSVESTGGSHRRRAGGHWKLKRVLEFEGVPGGVGRFVVFAATAVARESVARFLGKMGLEPGILHEQPNVRRSILGKLENNAVVGFAVVILTPDDEGKARAETSQLD